MNLTNEKVNNFCVLNIEGRVDTTNYSEFESEVNKLFEAGEKELIFDCSGLNYISSSGLRVFLIAQKKTLSLNGKLYLCNLQPAIKEIFDISGFSTIFKIFETRDKAIGS
ncbi:MAG: STAS domain-containing protein [Bacteroidales bacterium]|nr:STAS domain-containing protein [Bacteroidales bacterium]